jgi:hypothetical protein
VDILDRVIALRRDPTGVIPAVIHRGDLFEITGNPVGLAQFCCLSHNPGEISQ